MRQLLLLRLIALLGRRVGGHRVELVAVVEVAQVVDLDVRAAVCRAAGASREALLGARRLPAIVCLVLLAHH